MKRYLLCLVILLGCSDNSTEPIIETYAGTWAGTYTIADDGVQRLNCETSTLRLDGDLTGFLSGCTSGGDVTWGRSGGGIDIVLEGAPGRGELSNGTLTATWYEVPLFE